MGSASLDEERLDRRDFLIRAGFTLGSSTVAACGFAPVEKAIPYLIEPEEVTPGEPLFFASSCSACPAGCGLLVKTIDGRPIKLEGNPEHPISGGALCSVGQASILHLYDSQRLRHPLRAGQPSSWTEIDREISDQLEALRGEKRRVCFLTGTVHSPTQRELINRFLSTFESSHWASYDTPSCSAIVEAYEQTHGIRLLPQYQFDKAEVIVGLNADFLGTWISPVEFARGYRTGRALEGSRLRFSYHAQYESRLTLTGAKADDRFCVTPDQFLPILTGLAARIVERSEKEISLPAPEASFDQLLDPVVEKLWGSRGRSLLVCGVQDVRCQVLANLINELLGAYRRSIDLRYPSFQRTGDEAGVAELTSLLHEQEVGALFLLGVNPAYDFPREAQLLDGLQKVPCLVSFAPYRDETSEFAHFVCPPPHFLESWGDSSPTARVLNLVQPTVQKLGETRTIIESLSRWLGETASDRELVEKHWREHIFSRQVGFRAFEDFWTKTLHDGLAPIRPERLQVRPFQFESIEFAAITPSQTSDTVSLELYPPTPATDASPSSNPWLLELPDPLTQTVWTNVLIIGIAHARSLGLETGDLVEVSPTGTGDSLEVPVLIQPGQHERVVALSYGYGSKNSSRFIGTGPQWLERGESTWKTAIGVNAAKLLKPGEFGLHSVVTPVEIKALGRRTEIPLVQKPESSFPERFRHTPEGRGILREMTLETLLSTRPIIETEHPEDLWPQDHRYPGHHWAMMIDLGACTGCSACVIACQAENNIPVVGPDESQRRRALHWIRIQRYFTDHDEGVDVAFQPMLCQHCDNAPCESVCPVLATVHSEEGLNQQVYNRCVGTRYCANNCPYKVRTFNWFEYSANDQLENLQLNPDVTVRSRGVMEKCSFCTQRIVGARIQAKREGREIEEGELQTACQQTCPSQAIIFGDRNDPESLVSKLRQSPRGYRLLEELNTKPSITYLAAVRNRESEGGEPDE
ncbi:MAG: 4Fe-4S dicluster domain-containing protein [Acidobacteriota bacterium]|nr:MAG: 4Fe-4S dicluster domain-containing protein [Acidobacteriota bacterium]